MSRIFISYRRDDTGYIARLLADRLAAEFGDDSVFMDIDNIPLGVDFRDHISDAVSNANVVLALIGDEWLDVCNDQGQRRLDDAGDFVRIEIATALDMGIPLIPVLAGGAKMPSESDLPAPLARVAFRNAAELRSGRNLTAQLQGLVDALHELLDADGEPADDRPPDEPVEAAVVESTPLVPALASTAELVAPLSGSWGAYHQPRSAAPPGSPFAASVESPSPRPDRSWWHWPAWCLQHALLWYFPTYPLVFALHALFYIALIGTALFLGLVYFGDSDYMADSTSTTASGATASATTTPSSHPAPARAGWVVKVAATGVVLTPIYVFFWLPAVLFEFLAYLRREPASRGARR